MKHVLVATLMIVASHSHPALACTVIAVKTPAELVRDADVIVRVVAVEQSGDRVVDVLQSRALFEVTGRQFGTDVLFRVLEVLKGNSTADEIRLEGELNEQDDFNDHPVPYDFVRPLGRHGNCFAFQYKKGAEFLFLLHWSNGRLNEHWAALAPTNEQITGPADPWLAWVRKHLKDVKH